MGKELWTWKIMENLQDDFPYLWFGWDGIIPTIYYPY